ncbi:hyoscyamine 6-dioxygenase-like [Actinidia eriantha]|uniref:hyoscyamine 6-dioxygenase-like n=1 Tax=Actinidia eriantha TaxID=165200 RepID=UPI00258DF36D|nr:hyoscyamine 6-dioxygenase-like [Actinidia eriantha]
MSVLLSNWSKHIRTVPSSYVLPQEKRPGNLIAAPVCKSIPVIDLGQLGRLDRVGVLQQIMNACQDFGIFQVINHGVSEELMEDTMSLFKEFFDMPAEELAEYYSEDRTKSFRLCTSGMNHNKDDVNLWKDWVSHLCHPLENYVQSWPEKPARYREVVGAYAVEVRKLSMRVLDLICEGLGIEMGYFGNEISKVQGLLVNHYPPCPDPSLVFGVRGHCDPNLLTLLQQEVHGLQIFKDGQWAGVEPLPHAFVINICNQLEVCLYPCP